VEHVGDGNAVLSVGPVAYELLVAACVIPELHPLLGEEVTLYTIEYLEGNPASGNLTPRLVGFLRESDRDFFSAFVRVRSLGMRKALRAMAVPAHQIAAAISSGDEQSLIALPEIGKRTAAQIITDLHGKVGTYLRPEAAPGPVAEMSEAQRLAVEILVQWGDRRADAQRWVQAVAHEEPELHDVERIIKAAYRMKQRG
jgi:Holliday junction DNA helicase RuvA